MKKQTLPYMQVILAAVLFGASAPLAKRLLGEIEPTPLAACLYLGSGIILLLVLIVQRLSNVRDAQEAPLRRNDLPWLFGAILAGGVLAPILLMYSLRLTPAATAALLLNFETVSTTLIAALIFKESLNRLVILAIGLVTSASILLTFDTSGIWGISLGAVGVIAATGLWGLDNNLTRNISAKNPLVIVMIKGLAAGCISFILALLINSKFPDWKIILEAMLLGSLSYGLSIVLFVRALRALGSSRTSALFSVAPIAGVIMSLILFQSIPPAAFWLALPVMALGTILLMREEHQHTHVHKHVVHEHAHCHDDEHHNHIHMDTDVLANHSHIHKHEELVHAHNHAPDIHHRHSHA